MTASLADDILSVFSSKKNVEFKKKNWSLFQASDWQQSIFRLDKGLASNKRQAIL